MYRESASTVEEHGRCIAPASAADRCSHFRSEKMLRNLLYLKERRPGYLHRLIALKTAVAIIPRM